MVGLRPNGQGFDLNRDAIKVEAPETRGALEYVYNAWNPDVMMDLHTTDGTRHGWELTYSPSLNPNTDPGVMKLTREKLLPDVRKKLEKDAGILLFDYGNAEKRDGVPSWFSFEPYGRYCTNYAGLRNCIAVLSEATTYIPFKARVEATDKFVMATLNWIVDHSKEVLDATKLAAERTTTAPPSELGVRFEFESRGEETVLLEHKEPGVTNTKRPVKLDKVKMPIYDRFRAIKTAAFPSAYVIPPGETKTLDLLRMHGIVVEKLLEPWETHGSLFNIAKVQQSPRAFQGHKLIQLEGTFEEGALRVTPGMFLVRTSQPLGILAFQILEPEGQDGAAAWGFFGDTLKEGQPYPVHKAFGKVVAVTIRS
jgi:hypothetical protein